MHQDHESTKRAGIWLNFICQPDTSLPLLVSLVIREIVDVKEGLTMHGDHHR
jgi:hypothetical protein